MPVQGAPLTGRVTLSVTATCVPQGRATLDWPHPFRTGVSKGCTMQALGLNGVVGQQVLCHAGCWREKMRLQRQKPEKPSRARPLFGGEPVRSVLSVLQG